MVVLVSVFNSLIAYDFIITCFAIHKIFVEEQQSVVYSQFQNRLLFSVQLDVILSQLFSEIAAIDNAATY